MPGKDNHHHSERKHQAHGQSAREHRPHGQAPHSQFFGPTQQASSGVTVQHVSSGPSQPQQATNGLNQCVSSNRDPHRPQAPTQSAARQRW